MIPVPQYGATSTCSQRSPRFEEVVSEDDDDYVHDVMFDITIAPQSRAEMLRYKQQSCVEAAEKKVKVEAGAVLPTTNLVLPQKEGHQNQVVWAKVHIIAKAMEQNSNNTSR